MNLPKIMIGTPIFKGKDYCLKEFADSIRAFDYPKELLSMVLVDNSKDKREDHYTKAFHSVPNFKYIFVGRKGSTVRENLTFSQNEMRRYFLDERDYKLLFSLESDVIVPPDCIERLHSHSLPVVSAIHTYDDTFVGITQGGEKLPIFATNKGTPYPDLYRPITWDDFPKCTKPQKNSKGIYVYNAYQKGVKSSKETLLEVGTTSLGCLLIIKKVLEKVRYRAPMNFPVNSDVWFGQDVKKQGYKLFMDTSIWSHHLYNQDATNRKGWGGRST